MTEKQVSARTVVKSALRVLKLNVLQVDQSYQRDVKPGHKKIVGDFNEDALGIIMVGEREDGGFWIVDGQQRVAALKKLGRKDVRAEVFRSDGPEHEAAIFKLVNMGRIKLKPVEEYKALLTAHDPLTWKIKEAVESLGYTIPVNRSGNVSPELQAKQLVCIKTLFRVAKIGAGIESLKFMLRCADAAWPADKIGIGLYLVGGLSMFYTRMKGQVDEERLIARLKTVTPHKIVYKAINTTISGNRDEAVADCVEELYKKRLTKK